LKSGVVGTNYFTAVAALVWPFLSAELVDLHFGLLNMWFWRGIVELGLVFELVFS
jgi:hypothetical protein